MTILCVTTEWLPGIVPCRHLGEHRVSCRDHEGWQESLRPGVCRGCLPRKADVGYLCQACWDRLNDVMLRWPQFRRLVVETEGRAVSPEGGSRGAAPEGYTNLPLTFLTLDECDRLLRSGAGETLDAWVHTHPGARDAIMFAHAAARAYQSLEVERRELCIERVRCPHCERLTLTRNPTREHGGATIVECQHCGEQLDKIRDIPAPWRGSEICEHPDVLTHPSCTDVDCRCECHHLGRTSTAQGVAVLWDADQYAAGYVARGDWIIAGGQITRRPETERKTA